MSPVHHRFLPDRLRPRAPRRRSRRRFFLPALAAALVLVLMPTWKVQSVVVSGADVVPESVSDSLEGLAGHCVWLLDLEWSRMVAATWPAADEVRVRLDLPGTLVVEIIPEPVRGSVAVGAGWHAVAADGRLAGTVDEPRTPRLEGFRRPSDRRAAFGVARRLSEASGGDVVEIRQVTPADFRVGMHFTDADRVAVVHVSPTGTAAERAWCELVRGDRNAAEWADLRWPHRMVLRAGATQEARELHSREVGS